MTDAQIKCLSYVEGFRDGKLHVMETIIKAIKDGETVETLLFSLETVRKIMKGE